MNYKQNSDLWKISKISLNLVILINYFIKIIKYILNKKQFKK